MASKLTTKREKFVLGLVEGKSQRQAYKDAFDASRMKDGTIDKRASELFAVREVRGRYDELMDELKAKSIMSTKEVLEELSKIGRARITDFLQYESIEDYGVVVSAKDSSEIDGSPIAGIKLDAKGTFSFKLHDKVKALELLGKHLGAFSNAGGPAEQENNLFEVIDQSTCGEVDTSEIPEIERASESGDDVVE